MNNIPAREVKTTVPTEVVGSATKKKFVPTIVVGKVVPPMIVVTGVPTRAVGTAAKEILFLQSLLEHLFPQ